MVESDTPCFESLTIIIPKLLIFFSKELKDKAILGMDILSLFDFQYLREKRSTNGTFWINNYQDVLDNISKRMLNQELDYLDPSLILSIVIEDTNKNDVKFTLQDAMAAYINKKISKNTKLFLWKEGKYESHIRN